MDFRLDDEQQALQDALAALCARHFAEPARASDAAWNAFADTGGFGFLLSAEDGGALAAAIAFEQLGAHLAGGPFLWTTLAAPVLPGAATGSMRVAGAVAAEPLVVEYAANCDVVVVVHPDRIEQCRTADFPAAVAGEPFDPLTPAATFTPVPRGAVIGDADAARTFRRAGALLAAASLVGVAQGALAVATGYARERHQFGVPIGSFQAVKHLLADMYVRTELARSAMYAAAAMFDDPRAGDLDKAIATAKLLAGDAGIANGRTAVQVLGGMGFTWEMRPHYFLKRAWVLEQSFGTGDEHALALGDAVAAEPAWT
jgi:alkylation response protein AidB-like acyl-CoA dehydrogenase